MKKVKSLLILLELLIIVSSFITPVFAFKTNSSLSEKEKEKDVASWIQGYVPADNSLINPNSSNSETINGGGCSHFAMSYALVKMGILQPSRGDTPITFIKKARKHNAFLTDWGYFDFNKISKMYNGVTYEGRDSKIEGMRNDAAVSRIKQLMNKGYYIVAVVVSEGVTAGHCIFIDGINKNGTLSIGDSGYQGITWEETYGQHNTSINYVELIKCKGKDFNSQPSIYDGVALKKLTTDTTKKNNKITLNGNSAIVDGDAVLGMPTKSNLLDRVKKPVFYTRAFLTNEEKAVIASINGTKESEKISYFDIAKSVISFIGFIMIVYSLLLFLSFSVDRFNSFLDISLVSLLTLGKIKIVSKEDMYLLGDNPQEKGYVSSTKFFIIVGVILLVGSLLISGLLSYGIYKLIKPFL